MPQQPVPQAAVWATYTRDFVRVGPFGVYTRLGPPADSPANAGLSREPVRSWQESWEVPGGVRSYHPVLG